MQPHFYRIISYLCKVRNAFGKRKDTVFQTKTASCSWVSALNFPAGSLSYMQRNTKSSKPQNDLPMKKMIFTAIISYMALIATTAKAQYDDDDIYYSKSNARKAIYKETETWQTSANDDWNVDDYNRRSGDGAEAASVVSGKGSKTVSGSSFSFELPGAGEEMPVQVVHDTVYVVEQYYYSDRIRRFHNPYFTRHIYSPFYDVAFYDPFFWDYCYYDPWWYVTPSFGFHYGSWYGGWNFGYYTGWYGGWYAPYYHPMPHYYHPSIAHHWRPLPNRGGRINNAGGHYRNTPRGWRAGDRNGDSSRYASNSRNGNRQNSRQQTSASGRDDNRRAGNNAQGVSRVGASRNAATATPATRQASNFRGQTTTVTRQPVNADRSNTATNRQQDMVSRSSGATVSRTQVADRSKAMSENATAVRSAETQKTARSYDNSSARRSDNGLRQSATGKTTVRQTPTQRQVATSRPAGNTTSTTRNANVSNSGNTSSSSRSYTPSNNSPSSRSSYSSGSNSGSSSRGSFSGSSRSSGGGGSRSGRR